MYRVKRKRIKTSDRVMVAGDTFQVEELGIAPGPKLDRLLDRLTRLDMVIEIEGSENLTTVINNVTVVKGETSPEVSRDLTNTPPELIKAEEPVQTDNKKVWGLEDLENKGPWYYLPNGEKVKGKKAALEALVALNGGN